MTQEEKQLLIKDLCARLPYGFTVHRYSDNRDIAFGKNELDEFSHFLEYSEGEEFKPYLRSMSSMTDEEKSIMSSLWKENNKLVFADPDSIRRYRFYDISVVDFLNKHHLDYRGLIEKGLAIEAPEGMYKTE